MANVKEDYSREPTRRADFDVNAQQPFNAEPPADVLREHFVTPQEHFYVRNHAPVPIIEATTHKVVVDGLVIRRLELTLDDLKREFPEKSCMVTLMCAGNRRTEMSNIKKVRGVGWGNAALSNGVWTGVSLRDVLLASGADVDNATLHVEFSGLDPCKEEKFSRCYAASIPIAKAVDPKGDVMLAWSMNGEELTPDHGYPIRAVVPGVIGARSVKWLKYITVQAHESTSFFQKRDYKIFLNTVDWDNVTDWWDRTPAIQQLPVTAAITQPKQNECLTADQPCTIKGYAISNGNKIQRVDISLDGGKSWHVASLFGAENNRPSYIVTDGRDWSWTFWQLAVDALPAGTQQIVCRAFDTACNTMPDDTASIWNLRGVLNNSWHRVNVKVRSKFSKMNRLSKY